MSARGKLRGHVPKFRGTLAAMAPTVCPGLAVLLCGTCSFHHLARGGTTAETHGGAAFPGRNPETSGVLVVGFSRRRSTLEGYFSHRRPQTCRRSFPFLHWTDSPPRCNRARSPPAHWVKHRVLERFAKVDNRVGTWRYLVHAACPGIRQYYGGSTTCMEAVRPKAKDTHTPLWRDSGAGKIPHSPPHLHGTCAVCGALRIIRSVSATSSPRMLRFPSDTIPKPGDPPFDKLSLCDPPPKSLEPSCGWSSPPALPTRTTLLHFLVAASSLLCSSGGCV